MSRRSDVASRSGIRLGFRTIADDLGFILAYLVGIYLPNVKGGVDLTNHRNNGRYLQRRVSAILHRHTDNFRHLRLARYHQIGLITSALVATLRGILLRQLTRLRRRTLRISLITAISFNRHRFRSRCLVTVDIVFSHTLT